ncbi:hypothetical protein Hypma_000192 [Hypsizygus marmoreus]|uniref:C2H2-type domain-containing protein n=1 Tax=Hypsizygus marmoreus TaxID=39966 RepID=A0A369J992_HYPMA|nr:hypothetical protein Hypma_000192 [Hypsizygus marmoreus]
MSSNFKRHRAPSQTSSSSSTSTEGPQHLSKASRTTPVASDANGHPLLCTLPPTCNHRPTPLASTRDLETHYATYHAHVCEQHGCGAVFPDARLLELHQTECHDPLAAVRKDRGEKIFACHLASCTRLFLTPKARRLHLIEAHAYPKQYFFAVTNKGVGGLLKRWGEGVSMIRGEWTPREETNEDVDEDEGAREANDAAIEVDSENHNHDTQLHDTNSDEEDISTTDSRNADEAIDGLADTMGSLTLIPPSIRFGRGGIKGGFLHPGHRGGFIDRGNGVAGRPRGRGRGGRGRGRGAPPQVMGMDIDTAGSSPAKRPLLGRAGRGRAGIVHIPQRGRGSGRGTGPRGGAV